MRSASPILARAMPAAGCGESAPRPSTRLVAAASALRGAFGLVASARVTRPNSARSVHALEIGGREDRQEDQLRIDPGVHRDGVAVDVCRSAPDAARGRAEGRGVRDIADHSRCLGIVHGAGTRRPQVAERDLGGLQAGLHVIDAVRAVERRALLEDADEDVEPPRAPRASPSWSCRRGWSTGARATRSRCRSGCTSSTAS